MLIHLPAVVNIAEYTTREKTAIVKRADNRKCGEIMHSLRSREESCLWRPSVRPSFRPTVTIRLTLQGSSDFHETHSYWTFHAVQNKKTWSLNSVPPCLVLNSLWTQRYLYRQWLWQVAARQAAVLGNAWKCYSRKLVQC